MLIPYKDMAMGNIIKKFDFFLIFKIFRCDAPYPGVNLISTNILVRCTISPVKLVEVLLSQKTF